MGETERGGDRRTLTALLSEAVKTKLLKEGDLVEGLEVTKADAVPTEECPDAPAHFIAAVKTLITDKRITTDSISPPLRDFIDEHGGAEDIFGGSSEGGSAAGAGSSSAAGEKSV